MTKPTLFLVAIGLALRLFLIFPGPLASPVEALTNKADLRNYYWPAQTALTGANPYALWANGASGEFRADLAPLELLVYVAAVAVWNDIRVIQIVFALFDALNIALLGWLLRQSRLRLPFQIFYALGPLTLYNLALVPQDKTILLTLTFVIFALLLKPAASKHFTISHFTLHVSHATLAIVAAALLASFKWLSIFYILPLLLYAAPRARDFFRRGILFGAIIALTHLPWIPDWLYVYQFRSARIATPSHTAPAALLREIGWFDPRLLIIGLALALLCIYALYWLKRLDIFETIALAAGAGIWFTPDMDPVHLSLVVIHLLFIFNWTSRARLAFIGAASAWTAAVYLFSTRAGFARWGLPDFRFLTGEYGSLQMILESYVLFIGVFAFYLWDKARRHAVGRVALTDGH